MTDEGISYIKQYYPIRSTDIIAKVLILSNSQVRRIAKQHGIVKCEKYKQRLQQQLKINRRRPERV